MGETWPVRWFGLNRRRCCAAGLLLAGLAAIWASTAVARSHRSAAPPPATRPARQGGSPWSQVDRLITEQHLQEAIKLLQKIQKAAQTANRDGEASRAAIRLSQVRMTLSNYEMAVTVLHDQLAWQAQGQQQNGAPAAASADELSQATLAMFYAQALGQYAQMYSFQVGQRERGPEPVGPEAPFVNSLRGWTAEELSAQAQVALETAWKRRAALGQQAAAALSEYVEPGTLPPLTRPTLRDLLTYQYAELLARQKGWRADQRLGVPVTEVAALGRLDGPAGIADRLLDAELHPLAKLAALLGDLAAWHQGAGRNAAAVEAKLTRLLYLHQAFADEDRRAPVRAQLGELLHLTPAPEPAASLQAALAEMLRSDFADHPDRAAPGQLARAYALATQGAQRSPDSPGGKRCRVIVQALAAAAFHLDSMAVDEAGKRSIQVTHRNLPALHFRAYKYDPVQRLLASSDDDAHLTEREIAALLRSGQAAADWTTPLPATPDLQSHVTFVTPPLAEPGGYLILASVRADFALTNNHLQAVRLLLSDLVLWATADAVATRLTAVSGRSGEPLAGVAIASYQVTWQGTGPRQRTVDLVQTARTGPEGSVELPHPGLEGDLFFVGRLGSQVALVDGRSLADRERAADPRTALIYTDSSVYRPLQTVRWKIVAYQKAAGAAAGSPRPTAKNTPLAVTLVDADFQQVQSLPVTTNQFGTAAGEFTLPAGRRRGPWRITTSYGGESILQVEPLKRPGFTVTLAAPESPTVLGQPVVLRGQAHYFFGAPVSSGRVRWQVLRQREPPWTAGPLDPPGPASQPAKELVAAGVETVHPDGTFVLRFTPQALPPAENRAGGDEPIRRFQMLAEIADDSGDTGAAQRSFPLGAVAVHAQIHSEREFWLSGQPAELHITRRDLAGPPLPGTASWRLLRLQPPTATPPAELPRRAAERFASGHGAGAGLQELPDGPEQAHGELLHGPDGLAALRLDGLPAGVYRLYYQSRSASGQSYQTCRELLVMPAPGQGSPNDALGLPALLLRERPLVKVGDTARFAVASGISGQALFLEIRRAGIVTEHRLVHAGGSPLWIELPVQLSDRGGIAVTLTAVIDHQLVHLEQSVSVPWDDRALQLEFSAFRDLLQPGTKETFRVTVKTASGAPPEAGTTELLAYMYDRRLDEFAEPAGPDPALTPRLLHNLGRSPPDWQYADEPPAPPDRGPLRPDRLRQRLNFSFQSNPAPGVARLAGQDSATADALPPIFAPAAFFRPHLLLAPSGSAVVEFTVPDSTTPWNVVVSALTTDLRAGTVTRPTQSGKELWVQSAVPRFLREGDRADLNVVVNSAAPRALSGQVRIEVVDPATGADLSAAFGLTASAATLPFRLGPGDRTQVRFTVTAPHRLVQAALRVVATAQGLSDAELHPLPVLPERMQLTQSRSMTLKDHDRKTLDLKELRGAASPRDPNESLVVTLDASLAATLVAALPSLAPYPADGVEPALDRFVAASLVDATLKPGPAPSPEPPRSVPPPGSPAAPAVNRRLAEPEARQESARPGEQRNAALAKLRQTQTDSGGLAMWPGGPPSPAWTLYAVTALGRAAELGVEVPADLLRNAWRYLGDQFRERYANRWAAAGGAGEFLIRLNYAAGLAPSSGWLNGALSPTERQQILQQSVLRAPQLPPLLTAQLALTLQRLGQAEQGAQLLVALLATAQTTAEQGTFWPPAAQPWIDANDPVEGPALVVHALVELGPADPRLAGLLHWLLQQKQLNQSTRTTTEVLSALSHYLQSRGAPEARPAATVTVRGAGPPRSLTLESTRDRPLGGPNQLLVAGADLGRATQLTVEHTGLGQAVLTATYRFSSDPPPIAPGHELFVLSRRYYRRAPGDQQPALVPVTPETTVYPGDQIEVQLTLSSRYPAQHVQLRDPRAAGLEPIGELDETPRYVFAQGQGYYQEQKGYGTNFFFEELPAGQYLLSYRLRASVAGTFRVAPATAAPIYAPAFASYSQGATLTVKSARSAPP